MRHARSTNVTWSFQKGNKSRNRAPKEKEDTYAKSASNILLSIMTTVLKQKFELVGAELEMLLENWQEIGVCILIV